MSNHVGKEGVVKVGANTVAEMRDWSLSENANLIDDGELSDEYETHKLGRKSWNGSVNCFWDETDTLAQGAMVVGASITLNLYPEGDASGATYYTGTVSIESIERKGAIDGMVEASFTFKGNGAISEATV